ncbi:MAG: class I SAM-dependent methyltransferase [Nitratireductor sp.]|nr:class I SAM-dependent methyltransferase [Nitratireductor sp.]
MNTRQFASLAEKLAFQIGQQGPISLAAYMHACLADPQFGYYTTRPGIGEKADFITSPEVSQMFGELICGWCAAAWQQLGRPAPFCLAELGPGTGTLMADLLRAASRAEGFIEAAQLVLVEMSPSLRERQETVLQPWKTRLDGIAWAGHVSALPQMPLIAIANEFLDALPFRQYVKSESGWREIGIGTGGNGELVRLSLPSLTDPAILPEGADREPVGAIFEHAPAREAAIGEIATHLLDHRGAALLIDYGHGVSGFGDTFQAMRGHTHTDPFAEPGLHDLTSHVDFGRLVATAKSAGLLQPALATQADFLLELGLLERAGTLGHGKDTATQESLHRQVERLAGPDQMGNLFKVLRLTSPPLDLPGHGHGA